jgi:ABC-type Fe3+ transport system substrate-binding protein
VIRKIVIIVALAVILGVPLLLRVISPAPKPPRGARMLVVITPHVPQIRLEFGEAFERWHQRVHGEPAFVDWRSPGTGTSELLKLLGAQYSSAAKSGLFDFSDPKNPRAEAGAIAYDMMMGGGSFDHGRLKRGVPVQVEGLGEVSLPMSESAGFSEEKLAEWFGRDAAGRVRNTIGAGVLYDKDQYWIGTALSSFGIVYNREVLEELGVPEPTRFEDLADPRLIGMVILADPRQSGSVTTAIDAILNAALWNRAENERWKDELVSAFAREAKDKTPWEKCISRETMGRVELSFSEGWGTLREITANARTYTAAATKPPIDVSAGEGAAGIAIDFYGRGQAQAVLAQGEQPGAGRVAYVDPLGATYVDADPASILRGGPDGELARRFIEFCMTPEAQALWQLPSARSGGAARNPRDAQGESMGPRMYELRRMPVRPDMYPDERGRTPEVYNHFIDKVNVFEIAAAHRPAGWRDALGVMIGAFSVDTREQQRRAWSAILRARNDPGFPRDTLSEMEALFHSFPPTPSASGEPIPFDAAHIREVVARLRTPGVQARLEIEYTEYFRRTYQRGVELSEARGIVR